MDKLQIAFSLAIGIGIYSLLPSCEELRDSVITAINDNGQASHQELSQTKTNADVYNYAA